MRVEKEDGDSLTPESLRPYMDTFKAFLRSIEKKGIEDQKTVQKAKADDKMEF